MDLKEIQNLIKFVANSGVAEVKWWCKNHHQNNEGNVTETTYVQQMPAQAALHKHTTATITLLQQ
jgi:acetyl-CoA carboxylase biotin carboxyl carrier protein